MGEALEDTLDALREALAKRPEVLEAYLFGSTARGEQQGHSDVDVAVYVDRGAAPPTAFGYTADLTADLMRALATSRVDVVVLNDAPPLLYGRVLRDGIRICSQDLMASTRREGQALSRYCDYVPQLAKIDAAHHARIVRGDFGR
ncbi:MAG TPA: nucleotidyltransferase domain-containing protein [Thermoanaerobaculia bacterium]|nr:nucleotidyltransferase domain-containing protein [Thermoanaerobaculia bacterium]